MQFFYIHSFFSCLKYPKYFSWTKHSPSPLFNLWYSVLLCLHQLLFQFPCPLLDSLPHFLSSFPSWLFVIPSPLLSPPPPPTTPLCPFARGQQATSSVTLSAIASTRKVFLSRNSFPSHFVHASVVDPDPDWFWLAGSKLHWVEDPWHKEKEKKLTNVFFVSWILFLGLKASLVTWKSFMEA